MGTEGAGKLWNNSEQRIFLFSGTFKGPDNMPASMAGLLMAETENSLEKLQGFPGVLNSTTNVEPELEMGGLKVRPCLPLGVVPFLVLLGILGQVASSGPLQELAILFCNFWAVSFLPLSHLLRSPLGFLISYSTKPISLWPVVPSIEVRGPSLGTIDYYLLPEVKTPGTGRNVGEG